MILINKDDSCFYGSSLIELLLLARLCAKQYFFFIESSHIPSEFNITILQMRNLKLENWCNLPHHIVSGQSSNHIHLSSKPALLVLNISPTDWLLPNHLQAFFKYTDYNTAL